MPGAGQSRLILPAEKVGDQNVLIFHSACADAAPRAPFRVGVLLCNLYRETWFLTPPPHPVNRNYYGAQDLVALQLKPLERRRLLRSAHAHTVTESDADASAVPPSGSAQSE